MIVQKVIRAKTVYVLIFILLVALILRLYNIQQPFSDAFSWRQASTAMMAENFFRVNWNIFYPEVNWTGPGPNYQGREFQTVTYIAALLYPIFGQQDWVGRCVAIAFGLWGIFALYQLVCLVWGKDRAIASAAVMAILPGSIFIERSFLPDPAMAALVTTSLWLLVKHCQTNQLRYLIWAGFAGMLGCLTKLPGLAIAIPMAYAMLSIFGQEPKMAVRGRQIARVVFAAVISFIPIVFYYLWARHLALTYPPHHFAGSSNWVWDLGLTVWLQNKYFLPQFLQILRGWMWTLPIMALLAIGLVVPPNRLSIKNEPLSAPWVFHWWFFAGVIYYLIGAKELMHHPWNFHFINPAIAALSAHAFVWITSWLSQRTRPIAGIALGLIILLAIGKYGRTGLHYMYVPYAQESYELGLALREVSQPNDLVITMANSLGDPVAIYYSRRRGWVFPPAEPNKSWGQLPESDAESIRLLNMLRTEGADWLGIVHQQNESLKGEHKMLFDYIQQNCDLVQETDRFLIYKISS